MEDPIRTRRRPRLRFTVAGPAGIVRFARGRRLQAAAAGAVALGATGVMIAGSLVLAGGLRPPGRPHGIPAATTAPDSASGGAGRGSSHLSAASRGSARQGSRGAAWPATSHEWVAPVQPPWYAWLGPKVAALQQAADARMAPAAAYAPDLPSATPRTSCTSVVHLGDSTSDGLISSDYLPEVAQRIPARYAQIGVSNVHMEAVGGTSIVEEYDNQPNAFKVASRYKAEDYHGCWVIALGTNDTADVAAGSNVGIAARIREMMSVIGGQPVLWVNVKSLLSSGPYSESDMQAWNQALDSAQAHYPNMRVYDWASVVQAQWFINDGIHYTSAGYAARGQLIADALAAAFPASGQPVR